MSSFKDLRIVDNFYQTSSYIPMPTVMISTPPTKYHATPAKHPANSKTIAHSSIQTFQTF